MAYLWLQYGYLAFIEGIMIIRTKVFELCNGRYENLSELAQTMGISVSQIYRVREGKRSINQKLIIGALKAFPRHKLDDLFYLASKSPTVTKNYRWQGSVAKEKQGMESVPQVLEKVTSAIDEYGQHLISHTSALISLRQASQELKSSAEKANKTLSYLIRSSAN